MKQPYIQHKGKVINTNDRFSHVMALALDPRTQFQEGVIRCITSRKGDVSVKGFVDHSELRKVSGNPLVTLEIGDKLEIKNSTEIIKQLEVEGLEFIGLEDPDIWIDEENDLLHLFFTIPMMDTNDVDKYRIHLGHAVGKDLNSLAMTRPALLEDEVGWAKELSVAPINKRGFRYNLVESCKNEADFKYSVVRVASARDMGQPWEFGEIVFHPKEHGIPWVAGHASPGPLFSENFINIGEGKRLGILNGREANQIIDGTTKFGMFSIGLFIFDYENGKIDWVSPKPFIQDSEARTVTFASQFVETGVGKGILYAHVDDSFVRAYTLDAEEIKILLP